MKYFKLAAILVALGGQCFALLQAQIPDRTYRIDLSGHGYLKDLFDAGLEPKRSGDGLSMCVVQEKMLDFDLGRSNAITIPADICFFHVTADDTLYEINATSPPMTLETARQWMLPICRRFGRTDRELDDFLAQVRNGYDHFGWAGDDDEGFGAGMVRPPLNSGLPAVGARLQSRPGDKSHPVQIAVDARWEWKSWTLVSRNTPLMPPKGYEQLSMEPVPDEAPAWLRKGEEPDSFVKALYTPEEIKHMRDQYNARHGVLAVADSSTTLNIAPWLKWLLPVTAILILAVGWRLSRKR